MLIAAAVYLGRGGRGGVTICSRLCIRMFTIIFFEKNAFWCLQSGQQLIGLKVSQGKTTNKENDNGIFGNPSGRNRSFWPQPLTSKQTKGQRS
ncbi:hypothetical protein [Rhodobacteraceae phage LS06-2018-MD06]|nr:hypothetical protein [Rhodobacteraceae phage LS06-2018-MD06]